MKPISFIAALLLVVAYNSNLFCQSNFVSKNTFYAELATPGGGTSFNYDRIFKEGKKVAVAFRTGIGVGKRMLAFPLAISCISGKKSNHIEGSLTFVPSIETANGLFSSRNTSDKKITIAPGIGYRYQQLTGGLFLKIAAAPALILDPPSDNFWRMDTQWFFNVCAGIGYSF